MAREITASTRVSNGLILAEVVALRGEVADLTEQLGEVYKLLRIEIRKEGATTDPPTLVTVATREDTTT